MARRRELKIEEIGDVPEMLRLAEDVQESEEPRLLRRDGVDVAVLIPLGFAKDVGLRGPRTEADLQAFRAAAGSWADVDTDALIEDIYEQRGRPARSPVER